MRGVLYAELVLFDRVCFQRCGNTMTRLQVPPRPTEISHMGAKGDAEGVCHGLGNLFRRSFLCKLLLSYQAERKKQGVWRVIQVAVSVVYITQLELSRSTPLGERQPDLSIVVASSIPSKD